jgi:hypothetical protein
MKTGQLNEQKLIWYLYHSNSPHPSFIYISSHAERSVYLVDINFILKIVFIVINFLISTNI